MAEIDPGEWHPQHPLERIDVVVVINEDDTATLEAHGRSSGRRTALWTYRLAQLSPDAIEVGDHLAHVVVCALQDRPDSQPRAEFSWSGGLAGQGPLPFE